MPELPEVETIKRQIEPFFPMKVKSIYTSNVIDGIAHTELEGLVGKEIQKVWRKGKMLIFELSGGHKLLSHLGMTGSWRLEDTQGIEKHTHLVIQAKDKALSYVDQRRFGHLYLYPNEQAEKKISELGVDIASNEFTEEYLKQVLKKTAKREFKVALLDQKYFAGSGNYIANEIAARAGILPTRLCQNIKKNEIPKIILATRTVLEGATENKGTTFQGGYTDAYGNKGEGVQNLVVFYQKTCGLCHQTEVKKIMLKKRGTYYCPRCQH
jgi:formamidopyrimidine-DNA glycosylase